MWPRADGAPSGISRRHRSRIREILRWATYGVTELTATGASFSLAPKGEQLTDEWFGASLSGPGLCNYRVDFEAAISGPLYPRWERALGYGYAAGAANHIDNDVPNGTTVQFDPPFGGLRTVELPVDPNTAGRNAQQYAFVKADHYCHWQLIVNGMNMTVSRQWHPVRHRQTYRDRFRRYHPADLGRSASVSRTSKSPSSDLTTDPNGKQVCAIAQVAPSKGRGNCVRNASTLEDCNNGDLVERDQRSDGLNDFGR